MPGSPCRERASSGPFRGTFAIPAVSSAAATRSVVELHQRRRPAAPPRSRPGRQRRTRAEQRVPASSRMPAAEQRHQPLEGELGQQRIPCDLLAAASPTRAASARRRAVVPAASRTSSSWGRQRAQGHSSARRASSKLARRQQGAPAALDPGMRRERRRGPGGEHEPHVDAAAGEHGQDDQRSREAARVAGEPLEDAHGGGGQAALVGVQRPAGDVAAPRSARRAATADGQVVAPDRPPHHGGR